MAPILWLVSAVKQDQSMMFPLLLDDEDGVLVVLSPPPTRLVKLIELDL